eukprot:6799515-Pyramimonas_sp.AAC.1
MGRRSVPFRWTRSSCSSSGTLRLSNPPNDRCEWAHLSKGCIPPGGGKLKDKPYPCQSPIASYPGCARAAIARIQALEVTGMFLYSMIVRETSGMALRAEAVRTNACRKQQASW